MYRFFSRILFVICLLLLGKFGFAQTFSNKGKDFWVGYGHHQYMVAPFYNNDQDMVLYLCTADSAATVTVKIEGSGTPVPPPNGGPWTRTYTIPPNTAVSIADPPPPGVTITKSPTCIPAVGPIPKGAAGQCGFDARLITPEPPIGTGGEGFFTKKGIHITSSTPIVVYAHIYGNVNSGATMLMPVETWGYNYTAMNSAQKNADNAYSWMYIIANTNNTKVRITPAVRTRRGRPAGVPFDTVLNRGDIYQVIGELDPGPNPINGTQLTGTTVRSIDNGTGRCYPIAVFSGSSRTGGESSCISGSGRDNDMQQLFPEQAWGKDYLTAPFSNSGSPSDFQRTMYKVLVKDAATKVWRNGVLLTGIISNKYYYYESSTADYIHADAPVMVAQFMSGGSPCNNGLGDPEMVYVSPIAQAIKKVNFYRNTQESISVNYLTLIIPTAGLNSLKIDGLTIPGIPAANKYVYPHPNLAGYSVVVRKWAAAKTQAFVQSDSAFNAITYGLGGAESYGFNAGTFIFNLNDATAIHNVLDTTNKLVSGYTCLGTDLDLGIQLPFKPTAIQWQLAGVRGLFPSGRNFTIGDTVNRVVPVDSMFDGTKWIYFYRAPRDTIAGDTTRIPYRFTVPGKDTIQVLVANPNSETCDPFEKYTIQLDIRPKPVFDSAFRYTILDTTCKHIFFEAPQTVGTTGGGGGSSVRDTLQQWMWTYNLLDPQSQWDTVRKRSFDTTFPNVYGTLRIKLSIANGVGCYADTTADIIIPQDTVSFTVSPKNICPGDSVTLTPGQNNVAVWYWDFGDGTQDSTFTANPITHVYNNPGTYIIRHSIRRATSVCTLTAPPDSITVYQRPEATFTLNPRGCLPTNGLVQFTSTATAPGQVIASHAWTFGDPNATAGNPNTSTAPNPSHTYSGVGTYTITYGVTTDKGCRRDTSIVETFSVKPAVTFGPINVAPCSNNGPVTITSGAVTNGVTATTYYGGPGIINPATGLFDPSVAGPGVHTIWFYASTSANCLDSASQTVTVSVPPTASFTFPTGCLPNTTVQFTNTSTTGATYSWDFGDPTSGTNTSTAQNPSHTFSATGNYNVKLTVTQAGCPKDTTITVAVKVTPVINYPVLPAVCGNSSPVSVGTATVTNGVAGTGIYKGPGITNGTTGTFDPVTAGTGNHTIWYVFTTNEGCIDSASQTITVAAIPPASFTYPQTCLPDGIVQFTNTSGAPASATYAWDFGDPASGANTSTLSNPSHTFTGSGPFTVKLTVTTGQCSKDTTESVTVKIKPAVTYGPLTGQCVNAAPFSVGTGTVTNGVVGTGIYKGTGITDPIAGTFDPAIAGVGPHTIWYVFTSTLGCSDSASASINVGPTPIVNFTYPTNCLANTTVQFTNTGTAPGATIVYTWDFGDPTSPNNTSNVASPTHNFTTEGTYNVKFTISSNGCTKDTTIAVTVKVKPIINYPALTDVCANVAPYSLGTATITNSVAGTGVYQGPGITDPATGMFDPSIAGVGTHNIKFVFTSNLGCADSVTRQIIVKATPFASFTLPTTCLTNSTVQFTNSSTGAISYAWDFDDPTSGTNTSTANSPTHTFTGSGPYNVKLTATSNGCTKDTTIPVTVRVNPIINFPSLTDVCANVPAFTLPAATITNSVTGTGEYKGPGITNGATGNFDPSVAGVGTHTIWYVFNSALGCSDSVQRQITVKAVPFASFTFPTACLPNGTVQFTNASTGAATYAWDFGDPTSGTNTSTATSPNHTFTGSGPYNVKLTATSNGCSKDTTIPVTVKVNPIINFPTLTDVCANVPAFTLPAATVTNSVTGTGEYKGPGITNAATGNFDPSVAGVGTHTIWYVFTSALGCSDSVQRQITVKAVPFASFTFPTACLPNGTVQFTNASTGATTYNWDFGDPTSGTNTSTATSPSHTFTGLGPYNVKLTATSNGCSKDTTIPVTVKVTPILNYPAVASACGNAAAFSVGTATVTNGVTGTGTYNGTGITNATTGLFDPAVAGTGNHKITYIFTSTLGCIDSIAQTVTVKAVPKAGFTTPQTCLPNGSVQFTDTSRIPVGAGAATYAWTFGDPAANGTNPNTSASASPIHTYNTGTFNVKLRVTVNGCSDSTTAPITVRVTPALAYAGLNAVCNDGNPYSIATGRVTNGVPVARTRYSGPGITDTTSGIFDPKVAGVGTWTIWYVVYSTLGCVDSISSTITVKPIPVPAFTYPTGCLDNGIVQFTNTSTVAGGATMTYVWNFGDPASGSNTSTLPAPTHTYTSFGTYNINLKATANGCTHDTTIAAVFRLKPKLSYPALSPVCPVADTIPVGTAIVTNNVRKMSGIYRGPGIIDTTGLFVPSIAGPGTHKITYVFVSDLGCTDSVSTTITVHPMPAVTSINFINANGTDICADVTPRIGSTTGIGGGAITQWHWSFGDGSADTVINNGTAFNHDFGGAGQYDVTLYVVSDKGCVSRPITSRLLTVRALPVADFQDPGPICLPTTGVDFKNATASIPNDSLSYQWSFGDNTFSSLKDPVHVYNTSLDSLPVKLSVASAFGCKDDTTRMVYFFNKPIPSFTVRPTEVCQGALNAFIDRSYAASSNDTLVRYKWEFGSNRKDTSDLLNPTFRFNTPGQNRAKLTVYTKAGCYADTAKAITVYGQPNVTPGPSIVVAQGETVVLPARVNMPGLSIQWSPAADLNSATILNPVLKVNKNQIYKVVVTGQGGCSDSAEVVVNMLKPINVPNAFSPNGDGINDVWDLRNLADYPGSKVEVYNRYGQLVFLSQNRYTKSWDGTFNGSALPVGTYYYIITLGNGTPPISGYVAIIK